jgi:hypothetical protein
MCCFVRGVEVVRKGNEAVMRQLLRGALVADNDDQAAAVEAWLASERTCVVFMVADVLLVGRA